MNCTSEIYTLYLFKLHKKIHCSKPLRHNRINTSESRKTLAVEAWRTDIAEIGTSLVRALPAGGIVFTRQRQTLINISLTVDALVAGMTMTSVILQSTYTISELYTTFFSWRPHNMILKSLQVQPMQNSIMTKTDRHLLD